MTMQENYLTEETDIPQSDITRLCDNLRKHSQIAPALYEKYNVNRGLRHSDGSGVVAGITRICSVHGYVIDEGERRPVPGELIYRGYSIKDLVENAEREDRFLFEEIVYLLLMGELPTADELDVMRKSLAMRRELPPGFLVDSIMQAPSKNIMNKLARSILSLYSYDDDPEHPSLEGEMRIALGLIAKMPILMDGAYQAKRHKFDNASMIIHQIRPEEGTAESILSLIRNDRNYTKEEAQLLDIMLSIHAEHGGGNNSTFACRVATSSGTDPYAAYTTAINSLKGSRHGGANIKVAEMMDAVLEETGGYTADDKKIRAAVNKLMDGELYDRTGLVYGFGHAVYTISDPRAEMLRARCLEVAKEKKMMTEFDFRQRFERIALETMKERKGVALPTNVDYYSGFAYEMLGIPRDLYTPLFVCSRMVGWVAHNIENKLYDGRIMRPATKYVGDNKEYTAMEER